MTNMATNFAPHPGLFIREELEAREWTQRDLAFVLGNREQQVNMILNGKRGISPDMAKALAQAFDVPAEFFINLQTAYDLATAQEPDPSVQRRARLQEHYPIREMIKRGWLQESDSTMLDVQIARFFNVSGLDHVPHLRHAAKKTYYDETPPAQLAWLFRVRQIADSMAVPTYSEKRLREALAPLAGLRTAPEETRHVPRILTECGVRFVVVESLPNAKIDGVCFWLKGSPVIGMSIQRDQIDNFWFVLRHEIEHVLRKDGMQSECIDVELMSSSSANVDLPEQEIIANKAAADFCVPTHEMNDFVARVRPFFSEQRVVLFAQRLGIHPGLVVGQIQHRLDNFAFLKRHLPKVRQFVIGSATTDGWGQTTPISL